ncbi:MAG: class I SAM-dependent methyltransferase, partial [Pirellulaceae bacterium]|nr:class I SAM-dependent methyltransferase [Pirellulaceae bacterium]
DHEGILVRPQALCHGSPLPWEPSAIVTQRLPFRVTFFSRPTQSEHHVDELSMNAQRPQVSDYDVVDFPSLPFAASHPDRMATLGLLFGMQPTDVEHCRVLEIGCGAGGNILPMATNLPDSDFVGIDLSASQIDEALQITRAVDVSNLRLEAMDLGDLDESFGKFDYVICHGVYSWTTDAAREKILSICQQNLTPQGIAYVNYNTYPGWHLQGMVRDMISYHANKFEDPKQRTTQARAMISFFETALANDQSTYSQLLRNELQVSRGYSDKFLFHALLNVVNHPCYLHEFVGRAKQAGMQYLGDADISLMWAAMLPPESQATLRDISQETVDFEQHLDFLRNTMSRRSLLCHPDIKLDRTLRVASMEELLIGSNLRADPSTETIGTTTKATFRAPDGRSVSTPHPGLQVALDHLSRCWPAPVAFEALQTEVTSRSPEHGSWQTDLLNCVAAGLIELSQRLPACDRHVEEKPRATRLARYQAVSGELITDLRHYAKDLSSLDRVILANLDGNHDAAMLADGVRQRVEAGEVELPQIATTSGQTDVEVLISDALARFSRQAFLLRRE